MAPTDYQFMKKSRELEILKMVYPDVELQIRSVTQEQPDFLIDSIRKSFVFGAEVTEVYRNESSARLKHIPGYVDSIVERRAYRHKDDPNELKPDEFDILHPDGTLKHRTKGVMQVLPPLTEYLALLQQTIEEKNGKLANYAQEAKHHSLLIYDTEAYFGGEKLMELYTLLFSPGMEQTLEKTGFREVYFIGQFEHVDRYIPLKAYRLYAYLQQFEGYFLPTCTEGITIRKYIETSIAVLARMGFADGIVHQADSFISFAYGDLVMRIALDGEGANLFIPAQYLDYSDGIRAGVFSAGVEVDPAIVEGFRQYRATHSFHSTFAFPWSSEPSA